MKKIMHNKNFAGNCDLSETNEKILKYSAQFKVPFQTSKELALKQLKDKITIGIASSEPIVHIRTKQLYRLTAVAASIVLLFGVWFLWLRKPNINVIAEKGQHIEFKLPDGSLISVNSESKISYDKKGYRQKRSLSMEGEAFFNVKKGSAFSIKTQHAIINVLGTSFNVYARENSFKVSCVTGKILVISNNENLVIIPGESAIFNNNSLSKYADKNINKITKWREGEFYFENDLLSLIFKEIERQFNVTCEFPSFSKMYFTGSFTNKNLVNALDIVCIPMGLTYEIGRNSKIYIREKP